MSQNSEELIELTTCSSLSEAHVLRSRLEAEGLHPIFKDEHTHSVASHFQFLIGHIKLFIPLSELYQAKLVVIDFHKNSSDMSEYHTPQAEHDKAARFALVNAIMGVVILPLFTLASFYFIAKSLRQKGVEIRATKKLATALLINILACLAWYLIWKFTPDLFNPGILDLF